MNVGAAYVSYMMDVVHEVTCFVVVFAGLTVNVVVLRTRWKIVVVFAEPSTEVDVTWTGLAVMVLVMVDVGTLYPRQEQAVARVPLPSDPRAETAWEGTQKGGKRPSPAVWVGT